MYLFVFGIDGLKYDLARNGDPMYAHIFYSLSTPCDSKSLSNTLRTPPHFFPDFLFGSVLICDVVASIRFSSVPSDCARQCINSCVLRLDSFSSVHFLLPLCYPVVNLLPYFYFYTQQYTISYQQKHVVSVGYCNKKSVCATLLVCIIRIFRILRIVQHVPSFFLYCSSDALPVARPRRVRPDGEAACPRMSKKRRSRKRGSAAGRCNGAPEREEARRKPPEAPDEPASSARSRRSPAT